MVSLKEENEVYGKFGSRRMDKTVKLKAGD